jgi:hypothetical protein
MSRAISTRSTSLFIALAGAALVVALAGQRGTPGSLLPHGYCFTWNPTLLWTHVASDALIGAAYVSIPVTLLYLVRGATTPLTQKTAESLMCSSTHGCQ